MRGDVIEVFSEDNNGNCDLVFNKGSATGGNRYELYQKLYHNSRYLSECFDVPNIIP